MSSLLHRTFLLCLIIVWSAAPIRAQVDFTSSNLPIVLIETDEEIPDEPKVPGRMRVIDNGSGQRNHVGDSPTGYDGFIGIEVRGASSQSFPKKQYGIETRDASGDNRNVSILGMPDENDWVLHAPYSDKTLMRNALAYHMARATGRYASRTRWCEVVLNGEYVGVYVMMEKVKRDDGRIDVNNLKPDETSGDDLTGGYVIQLDRPDEDGWYSAYPAPYPTSFRPYFQYREPAADEIVAEQAAYIQAFMEDFESRMASGDPADPQAGYPSVIDVGSFVDFMLVNEAARNVDAYRLSTYFHKDKDSNDPLLHAGPVWDFNIAFGNAYYYDGADPEGYHYNTRTFNNTQPIPFWWRELANTEAFRSDMTARWESLRAGPFQTDALLAFIDSTAAVLDEAQARNFRRWPVIGRRVWPNDFVGETYQEEVDYLKGWLSQRLAWLDGSLPVSQEASGARGLAVTAAAPNPSRGRLSFQVTVDAPQDVRVEVYDTRGRRVTRLHYGPVLEARRVEWDASGLASGAYLIRVEGERFLETQMVTIVAP
ncbi:CotH kinase family protein [Rubricoccus marinus]|uniref:Secretion system C-terminal sorting domain-containing protein n=1 Tax=Rubricoccus marinus TaxID=716817 RepID=A0A259TX33_9BACT|nr:CotH kinase family protein [Rubricoccus marinus]OZC02256.1 hypothetical protein BSZ36_04180 [Rubricoccus marinus]